MSDPDKLVAVRAALPSLSAAIQLNTGTCGPIPAEAAAAMAELEAYERDFGRAQPEYWLESLQRIDEARAGVAAVIGGDLDEVALTHAATDGMNFGTWAIDWRDGGRAASGRCTWSATALASTSPSRSSPGTHRTTRSSPGSTS
jgi:selenocysteine lyase/cysteine desulfurase